ncbi:Phage tail protein [Chromobacterium violaceum]|uniref:hypothetical protein n=1 Tax=Chromobacterium violaceum TaxID=536 RepID=UPI0009DAACA8|nr:hypothetical protein [Chromobacterium violaceum]OQS08390.1 hypothetical protein B0T38_20210 [Chromobacterium violaceum]OQS21334.1 hypothetical protein B0T37_19810 [Chromobacterium violaceum]
MSLEQQVAALVTASNNLTSTVAGKQADIDAKVAAKTAELEAWRQGARSTMTLPFRYGVEVGGDANTYYPVPIWATPHEKCGRLVISRHYGAAHPSSLGPDHVAGLLLELSVRAEGWADFWMTRADYYGFAYHQAVAKVRTDLLGRVIWLRGGGMYYDFLADFDLGQGQLNYGTEGLKPLMQADSIIYSDCPSAPYKGGGAKVSPLTTVDPIWTTAITTPTPIANI